MKCTGQNVLYKEVMKVKRNDGVTRESLFHRSSRGRLKLNYQRRQSNTTGEKKTGLRRSDATECGRRMADSI
jgi:hypothetical protein